MAQINRISLVSLLALGLAMPAIAQNTEGGPQSSPQPSADQERDRDVVVVTAFKREETVQDIAVAVTAITDELRDEIGLTTVQDYTNFAPGLSYSTSNDRLGMRGVTRTSNNFGIRSGISNYVDGVYYSSAIPAAREPIFVERVEVVRGPQGTLYGRDSIGGALNLVSKRPTEELEGQMNLGFGDYDVLKAEASVSGPITDWLRYRVAGARNFQGEGFLTNVATGDTEAGRKDDTYIEVQLEAELGDRIDLWAKYGTLSWTRVGAPGGRTNAGSSEPYDTRLFGAPGGANINSFFGFSPVAGNVRMTGNQRTNPNAGQGQQLLFNADFQQFTDLYPTTETALEAIYHADGFDIKYLGGYVWYHYNLQIDNDGGPVSQFSVPFALGGLPAGTPLSVARRTDYNENRAWFSNEINLISTNEGPLQWVAGLYAYQENYSQPIYVDSFPAIKGTPGATILTFPTFLPAAQDLPSGGRNAYSGAPLGGDLWYFSNNTGNNNAYGAFLQTDYQLNDQWKLTAGLRWSTDIMRGSDAVRFISHYALGAPRVDGTNAFFGGPDPTTISATHPCGLPGKGIVGNTPENTAACADKRQFGIFIDPVTGVGKRQLAAEWEEVTGVLGVDWTPDDDTLIYGKYNRGYKPGGLGCADTNCNLTATPYTDKELVDAFELGFKREWNDWNLTTNATLFYYDYQGYQVSNTIVPEPDPVTGVRNPAYVAYLNLPKVETTGFELETIWYPTDNLRILFNYGYTNPEIGDSPSLVNGLDPFAFDPGANPQGAPIAHSAGRAATCNPADGGTNVAAPVGAPNCSRQQGQNLNGNILPFSPKNKIALNGTYTWDFEDGSTLDASASYFWQDVGYSNIFNMWATKIPQWDQVDARLSWTSADGMFTVIGFVRNLMDEIQYDSRGGGRRIANGQRDVRNPELCGASANTTINFSNFTGFLPQDCLTITETYRPPRTFGAELQIRF